MTKYEFLNILEEGLKDFPPEELQDILYDYKEHFFNAESEGKNQSEIIEELGDPYIIVNQYRNGYIQKIPVNENITSEKYSTTKDNTATKVVKLLILILGIVFISPFAIGGIGTILGLCLAFLAIPFAFSISGVIILISKLGFNIVGISLPAILADFPTSVVVLLTIGSIAGTILILILLIYLIKLIIIGIRKLVDLFSKKGGI